MHVYIHRTPNVNVVTQSTRRAIELLLLDGRAGVERVGEKVIARRLINDPNTRQNGGRSPSRVLSPCCPFLIGHRLEREACCFYICRGTQTFFCVPSSSERYSTKRPGSRATNIVNRTAHFPPPFPFAWLPLHPVRRLALCENRQLPNSCRTHQPVRLLA